MSESESGLGRTRADTEQREILRLKESNWTWKIEHNEMSTDPKMRRRIEFGFKRRNGQKKNEKKLAYMNCLQQSALFSFIEGIFILKTKYRTSIASI